MMCSGCGALSGSGTLSLPGIAIWVVQTASDDIYVSFSSFLLGGVLLFCYQSIIKNRLPH